MYVLVVQYVKERNFATPRSGSGQNFHIHSVYFLFYVF
jgi:hypothetical protein